MAWGGAVLKIKATVTFSHLIRPPNPTVVDRRTVTSWVKLSFYSDGFTQVSAANGSATVTSGRDPESGIIRGMGINGAPFSKPVVSGAVFEMTVWGLRHYPRTTIEKDTIRFSRLQLGKRGLLDRADVMLEGYLIHRRYPMASIGTEKESRVKGLRWNGILGIREVMELGVCNLHDEDSYLGIRCFRIPKPKARQNLSGYILSSQQDRVEHTGLHVFFPAPRNLLTRGTLDRGIIPASLILPLGGDAE